MREIHIQSIQQRPLSLCHYTFLLYKDARTEADEGVPLDEPVTLFFVRFSVLFFFGKAFTHNIYRLNRPSTPIILACAGRGGNCCGVS